jgi:uncharacterized coiled-coil protein SlyX
MSDERFAQLESSLAFLQQRVDDLSSTLIDKEHRLSGAELRVEALERALRVVAQRQPPSGESPSGLIEEDPVPHSG